jgi:hypothetical protein
VVGRLLAAIGGALLVVWTLASALQTVVVPRATPIALTRIHFRTVRRLFDLVAVRSQVYETRDRVLALYAPASLVLLPGTWLALVMIGFAAIFWATGLDPLAEAVAVSGASVVTLGFERPSGTGRAVLSFVEAGIGLGLLSLIIAYLPSIYAAFHSREQLVAMLEIKAGSPPDPVGLLARYADIGSHDRIEELFDEWERWFVEVEESHSSQGSLPFFRSPTPDRSWITAAGCILDTAAIYSAAVEHPPSARPDLLIRTGYLCLRRLAVFYGISFDAAPAPTDPISITRDEFDDVCSRLGVVGVPITGDREQSWRAFAGWRVNYDTVLLTLAAMVEAPIAPWSSDRGPTVRPRPTLHPRRRA